MYDEYRTVNDSCLQSSVIQAVGLKDAQCKQKFRLTTHENGAFYTRTTLTDSSFGVGFGSVWNDINHVNTTSQWHTKNMLACQELPRL